MSESAVSSFTDKILDTNCFFCVECGDILQVPIMLIKGVGNVCYKCFEEKYKDVGISLNNFALEKILHLLQLPCKFREKGCNERLHHPQLSIHQKECQFRTKFCLMCGCDWEGNTADFINHFKEYHGDHVVNFEKNISFLETSLSDLNLVKLLVTKCHNFMLRMQTNLDMKKLYYMICCISDSHTLFDYSVKHKGSSDNYIKTKSKILPSCHIYEVFDEKLAVAVDLPVLQQLSHNSETITNVFKIKFDDPQVDIMDEKMMHFFGCPVCLTCMKPPIYQCQSGHSICNLCRSRLEECPTCHSMYGTTRNYSLEGLISSVQYNCVYHDLGCLVNASAPQITKHEKMCTYKSYNCPIEKCNSKGNHLEIISHLTDFHSDVIYCTPGYQEYFRLNGDPCSRSLIDRRYVIAFNHIFRLSFKRVAEHCLWAGEIVGYYCEKKTFAYKVSILNMMGCEKKLTSSDYCLVDVSEDELFKKCVKFPDDILSDYCFAGLIEYRVDIKEM